MPHFISESSITQCVSHCIVSYSFPRDPALSCFNVLNKHRRKSPIDDKGGVDIARDFAQYESFGQCMQLTYNNARWESQPVYEHEEACPTEFSSGVCSFDLYRMAMMEMSEPLKPSPPNEADRPMLLDLVNKNPGDAVKMKDFKVESNLVVAGSAASGEKTSFRLEMRIKLPLQLKPYFVEGVRVEFVGNHVTVRGGTANSLIMVEAAVDEGGMLFVSKESFRFANGAELKLHVSLLGSFLPYHLSHFPIVTVDLNEGREAVLSMICANMFNRALYFCALAPEAKDVFAYLTVLESFTNKPIHSTGKLMKLMENGCAIDASFAKKLATWGNEIFIGVDKALRTPITHVVDTTLRCA